VDVLRKLVIRAQAGDLEAYGRVTQATQAMAYASARGVLRDPALAEDAAQEAFLRAFRHLRRLDVCRMAAPRRDHGLDERTAIVPEDAAAAR
jgi:DNA-directed RNA polymerase specialized sigma24 family protein